MTLTADVCGASPRHAHARLRRHRPCPLARRALRRRAGVRVPLRRQRRRPRAARRCCAWPLRAARSRACRSSPSTRRAATSPGCTTRPARPTVGQRRPRPPRRHRADAAVGGGDRARARGIRHRPRPRARRRRQLLARQPRHRGAQLRRRRRPSWRGTSSPGSRACSRQGSPRAPSTSRATATPSTDSHLALPRVDVAGATCCDARELVPFRRPWRRGRRVRHDVARRRPGASTPSGPATFSPDVLGTCCATSSASRGSIVTRRPRHGRRERRDGHPGGRRAGPRRRGATCSASGSDDRRGLFAVVRRDRRGGAVGPAARASGWPRRPRRVRALAGRRSARGWHGAAHPATGCRRPAMLPAEVVAQAFRVSDAARAWLALVPAPGRRRAGGVGRQPRGRRRRRGVRPRWARRSPRARCRRGARVAVVGRGPRRRSPGVRGRATGFARRATTSIVVECGWPRGGADLETFGGSPVVARALLGRARW